MLAKRIIPCLDVDKGKGGKGCKVPEPKGCGGPGGGGKELRRAIRR
jgi:imidazole glycerol phosphate synthase subunit HisF